MLYYLIQASEGKDITLHVSANNPAMVCDFLLFSHFYPLSVRLGLTRVLCLLPLLLDHVPKVWIQTRAVFDRLLQRVPPTGQRDVP